MKIYTKKGDLGKTRVFDGSEIYKDHETLEANGTLDELNSLIGVIRSESKEVELKEKLENIQKDLFNIQTEISGALGYKKIGQKEITRLEKWIDEIENVVPPLKHFILPSGSYEASMMHLARTVTRRAERKVVKAFKNQKLREEIIAYMNRLSDLFFMIAREINYKNRVEEIEWKGKKLL